MDLSKLDTIIRERRGALGLAESRLAQLRGLSRQALVGLEAGALSDLGFNRVAQVPAVPGLDLDPPSLAARDRKRGLWMAAKYASVRYVQQVPPDTLGHALVNGSVPTGDAAHLTHLLDEAPVHLMVMAVAEAAASGGVATTAVWRHVAKLARTLRVVASDAPDHPPLAWSCHRDGRLAAPAPGPRRCSRHPRQGPPQGRSVVQPPVERGGVLLPVGRRAKRLAWLPVFAEHDLTRLRHHACFAGQPGQAVARGPTHRRPAEARRGR